MAVTGVHALLCTSEPADSWAVLGDVLEPRHATGMNITELGEVLGSVDTLVVVGCSADPAKEAHNVPARMQQAGYRIIPVNPRGGTILGERAYVTVLDVPGRVEFVNLFRPGPLTPPFARQAVQAGARILWLQEGIVSAESRAIAEEAGLVYVEDACIAVVRAANRLVKGQGS